MNTLLTHESSHDLQDYLLSIINIFIFLLNICPLHHSFIGAQNMHFGMMFQLVSAL